MGRPERFSIVLARIEEDMQATGDWTRFDGYNYKRKVVAKPKAIAAMWLHDAHDRDIPKAKAFAAAEGYTMVLVPRTERDPLSYAKRRVLGEPA